MRLVSRLLTATQTAWMMGSLQGGSGPDAMHQGSARVAAARMAASGAQAPTESRITVCFSQITSSTEPNALVQPAASAAHAWQGAPGSLVAGRLVP